MDELEERIRAARPPSGNRGMPLTDRAERDLAALLAEDQPATGIRRPRRGRVPLIASFLVAAAAVLGMLAIALPILLPPAAYAATPPILVAEKVDGTAEDWLGRLAETARAQPEEPRSDTTVISFQQWALSMEAGEDGETIVSTVVEPIDFVMTIRADGSATQKQTAGEAWASDGDLSSEDAPDAGTPLGTTEWAPGEYAGLFPAAAPDDADALAEFLSPLEGDVSIPGVVMQGAVDLMTEQKLDGRQYAAILDLLARSDGVTIEGRVVDRLGREGIELSASDPSREGFRSNLIVSESTGRILSFETLYVGSTRTDIPSPAVTTYIAWT